MATKLTFFLTETVNDVVACDQLRAEIQTSGVISVELADDPLGIMCTTTIVQIGFVEDLPDDEEPDLLSIIQAHTGEGIMSPDTLDHMTVAELPTTGMPGDTFYVTDGGSGPGPAYFDGSDWRWYSTGAVVV